jgi:hypothetical protein
MLSIQDHVILPPFYQHATLRPAINQPTKQQLTINHLGHTVPSGNSRIAMFLNDSMAIYGLFIAHLPKKHGEKIGLRQRAQ